MEEWGAAAQAPAASPGAQEAEGAEGSGAPPPPPVLELWRAPWPLFNDRGVEHYFERVLRKRWVGVRGSRIRSGVRILELTCPLFPELAARTGGHTDSLDINRQPGLAAGAKVAQWAMYSRPFWPVPARKAGDTQARMWL